MKVKNDLKFWIIRLTISPTQHDIILHIFLHYNYHKDILQFITSILLFSAFIKNR